ncbi:MAG: GrpB family protein [Chlamydiota bacterium]|nr:GrpB family protein [Chlamydiota bacterium]
MKGIENYSSEWPKKYEVEAEKIKAVLGDHVKDIQHIGSTSIPNMIAKPLIDIGVLVDSIDDIDFLLKTVEPLGYTYKPDMSSVERIFLRKGDPVEYHLSIACPRHMFWKRQILFRNYLRNHPEYVEEYNALKLKNIATTPDEDFSDLSRSKIYNQGKGDFTEKILKLAEAENATI